MSIWKAFCVLSQPCFRTEETYELIECYLLARKPKGDLFALLSWTETVSLGTGDVRILAMPIINQVCKGSREEGAN